MQLVDIHHVSESQQSVKLQSCQLSQHRGSEIIKPLIYSEGNNLNVGI